MGAAASPVKRQLPLVLRAFFSVVYGLTLWEIGEVEMASKFCTKCGSPVVAGKRFCGKCGQPIAQPAPEIIGKTAEIGPARQELGMTELPPKTAAPATLQTMAGETSASRGPAIDAGTPLLQPLEYRPSEAAPAPDVPRPAAENNSPTLPPYVANNSVASGRFVTRFPGSPAAPGPEKNKSWVNLVIIVGTSVVLLSITAFAVWLYVSHVRARPIQALAANGSTQPIAARDASVPTGLNDKPNAATPMAAEQVPAAPSEQAHKLILPPPSSAAKQLQKQPSSPVPVQRSNAVVPKNPAGSLQNAAPAPAPSAPTSGVLHYSGPPVPYGGTVVFINLPSERLSFTFDHQSWQPLISRQPDGTQKLTLRSLRQGEQTQCDVEWKVIK
jgi:hypothetical protein